MAVGIQADGRMRATMKCEEEGVGLDGRQANFILFLNYPHGICTAARGAASATDTAGDGALTTEQYRLITTFGFRE